MPGKFPEEETPYEVVLVYQLVDAIFDISQSPDVPRVRVWKYYPKRLNGAKQVRNLIWKMFQTKNELSGMDQLKILDAIKKRLKPSYAEEFESQAHLTLRVEFIRRLKGLHRTWINSHKPP